MHFYSLLLVLLLKAHLASAGLAFDASVEVNISSFECLKNASYSRFIGRVWRSLGVSDAVGIQNIKNARAAGFGQTEAYIYPCLKTSCATAANQVEAAINKLSSAGIGNDTQLWLDVELNEVVGWPSDKEYNRQFIRDMIAQVERMGYRVGIYTNLLLWELIVGNWTITPTPPLWWVHYNGKQDFSDFIPFCGWETAVYHQYSEHLSECGVDIDQNWFL